MERPTKVTFLCLARPSCTVYITNPNRLGDKGPEQAALMQPPQPGMPQPPPDRELVGRVELPFDLCGYRAVIYDEDQQPIYTLLGSAFQCQTCFLSLPTGPCKESCFSIHEYTGGAAQSGFLCTESLGEPMGRVYKRWSNCYKMGCSTAPWYIIDFPPGIDWKRKVLIISAVQLLDLHYFEKMCQ